jgi:hypothetical protein
VELEATGEAAAIDKPQTGTETRTPFSLEPREILRLWLTIPSRCLRLSCPPCCQLSPSSSPNVISPFVPFPYFHLPSHSLLHIPFNITAYKAAPGQAVTGLPRLCPRFSKYVTHLFIRPLSAQLVARNRRRRILRRSLPQRQAGLDPACLCPPQTPPFRTHEITTPNIPRETPHYITASARSAVSTAFRDFL